jgi:hypothetical protein
MPRTPNGNRTRHARHTVEDHSPRDVVWHVPFNTQNVHARAHNFKINIWDQFETSSFSVFLPQDFNACEACCSSILPVFCCSYYCCDDNSRTFSPWYNAGVYKDCYKENYSDLISSEDFTQKLVNIWQKVVDYNGRTGYATKRNCGQAFYCFIGDWFDQYDERGYGSFVNWRKKELMSEIAAFVSQQSDDKLEFSLQWQASYPDINLSYKEEVDQLKEASAWSGLTVLPTGFSIQVKGEDGYNQLPIESYAYDLQVVVRRKSPKPNFIMPPIELSPSDQWLSCIPGFEFLPSQWRQVEQSEGRLWQTVWKADVASPGQYIQPANSTGVKNGLLNVNGQPYVIIPQGQQTFKTGQFMANSSGGYTYMNIPK